MDYTDIIVTREMNGVKVTVVKANLLEVNAAIVLPINEFFSIQDNDWRDPLPKSVLGQFIKRLSPSEREKFQTDIDVALGRNRADEGKIGYPYGSTITLKAKDKTIFLTNTVKYDMQAISATYSDLRAQTDEFYKRYYWAQERQWTAPDNLLNQNMDRWDKKQVYYDTFLLAIELCIEGIIHAARTQNVDRLALPLLGAGWGGLDEKLVLRGILAFLRKFLEQDGGSLNEVTLVLPPNSTLDRRLVIQDISESPYGTCSHCGRYHDDTPPEHRIRILEDELQIVETQIAEYTGVVSSVLIERRENLQEELKRLGSSRQRRQIIIEKGEITVGDTFKAGDIINVGGIQNIGKFNDVVANLTTRGQTDFAKALETLKDAIMASQHLSDDKKRQQIEVITELGEEAIKPQPNKSRLKMLGDGLMNALKAIPDVAKAVTALAPYLGKLMSP